MLLNVALKTNACILQKCEWTNSFPQKLVDSRLVVGCHRQKDYLRVPESKILQLMFLEKKSGLVGSGFVIQSHEFNTKSFKTFGQNLPFRP